MSSTILTVLIAKAPMYWFDIHAPLRMIFELIFIQLVLISILVTLSAALQKKGDAIFI
jgi:hypothetical protein